jgi:predicted RNase H-like nuclease (RuvC/YqgF family)
MSDIDRTRMIPLHIADQAVAACDAEIAKLREENARLKAEVERLTTLVESNLNQSKLAMAKSDASVRTLEAQVERLTKAVMHSPAAQLKLKELEGKTTFEDINPDNQ